MSYQLLSLFCGSGGLDHGFSKAGFKTVLALDNCPDAVSSFNANSSGKVAKIANLADLKPAEFLKMVPKAAKPMGLIGGPPCQGFSRGNVCADPTDPRNLLPFRYAKLLAAANKAYNLHFFVFENVIGLAGPKHANRYKRISTELRVAGFRIFKLKLNASDYLVPQRRRRLFIVGLNAELYPDLDFEVPAAKKKLRTVSDAIRGLPPPTFFARNLSPKDIPFHPNHWTMVPKSKKFASKGSSTGRSFKLLNWNEVSPTVAYGNREIHVHPEGDRRLSVLEAMLLQGFPKTYRLKGSLSAQITQVSNAVPPPMAEAIAFQIKSLLLGEASNIVR